MTVFGVTILFLIFGVLYFILLELAGKKIDQPTVETKYPTTERTEATKATYDQMMEASRIWAERHAELESRFNNQRKQLWERGETIRQLRAVSGIHPGYDEQRELLRRSYHAIRMLHEFRHCPLKGCEYCALGNDIVVAVGSSKLMQETTIGKLAPEGREKSPGIAGYLKRHP